MATTGASSASSSPFSRLGLNFYPDFSRFESEYAPGTPKMVWTRMVADMETPVSAMLKLKSLGGPSFLLESVEGGEVRGRYSIIGLLPDRLWKCSGNRAELGVCTGESNDFQFSPEPLESLASLKQMLRSCQLPIEAGLPPMAAGLIGYLGYDIVKLVERLPHHNPDHLGIPDAMLMRPQVMVIFDAVAGDVVITAPLWKDTSHPTAQAAYEDAVTKIERVVESLKGDIPAHYHYKAHPEETLEFASNVRHEEYCAMVDKAKEYIFAGDIFQIVPSQRFTADFAHEPFSFYRSLRHLNPAPFLFYLDFESFALVGSSPEILVRLRDGKVTIRPIAGTRKRGATPAEDKALEEDLLSDPKEIAEHLMLLDLGRNDVGRVARPGTVKVTEQMVIERYSHVMHIVSNVEGEIRSDHDAVDALLAGFPAGTVSGAPKIRAMEIIDELENTRRGFYGGCVGYFSANGSMDTCIALRTALIKDGKIHIQAGGGVVADSVPQSEYEETVNKAKALVRAAGQAVRYE
jgi:anthranilate synthase component 1